MSTLQSLKNSFTYSGIVLTFQGLLFLIFPHLTMKLLFFSPLQTAQAVQFVRTTGLSVAVIGFYYITAGKCALIDFYRASITGRFLVLPAMFTMIYFWSLEVSLVLFGIQDLLTGIWSYTCLKAYDQEQAAKIKK